MHSPTSTAHPLAATGCPCGEFRWLFVLLVWLVGCEITNSAERPNILWITSEDNGPYLGCYGDPVARTPHLDRFAAQATRYLNCFSNAAVCAPARQTLISGMYATSLGGQHMRSEATFPKDVVFFPKYLRDLGYYTANNYKTDYNGGPVDREEAMSQAWDESGSRAHWRQRATDQPFFAVFNLGDTHESQLFPARWATRELKTDPAQVHLPKYLPDLAETRLDLARYYDCLEVMDHKVGQILRQLEEDGLADETIVFYFADHGGALPRGKSFTYDSGTRVPLLVRVPPRWQQFRPTAPGSAIDQLVSFVDFAPTVLALAGLEPPSYMQGQSFLGSQAAAHPREFVHTFRGRRGERYDIVRGVRSKEYLYLRNYTSYLPVMQFNDYSFEIPAYLAWRNAWKRGQCEPHQAAWFEPKAPEELYRVADDPDNVRNLAADPKHAGVLSALRGENDRHLRAIRDSVFFPEGMAGRIYAAYQSESSYPLRELIPLANAVSKRSIQSLARFEEAMRHKHPCIRYWGVTGCVALGASAGSAEAALSLALQDEEPMVQLQAARALAGIGKHQLAIPVIRQFAEHGPRELALQAALAIDECRLLEVDSSLRTTLKKTKGEYAARVVKKLLAEH